ncbi:MAG TPA: S26 family signal peptidase [Candidatus Thermoplasmatota archaeon]|nr:S26 family signal peptidase [Candidatus Thermoplasmatota archaeon]
MARGFLRDTLILVAVFAAVLGGLWLYTGVWPPAVIVESNSMMHPEGEVPYGRFGTIDPGDLVLVKEMDAASIATFAEGGKERYGLPGEVLVFRPPARPDPPIIHRAIAWVDVVGGGETIQYRVRWDPGADCPRAATRDGDACVFDRDGVTIASANVFGYKAPRSGFITKGDHNPSIDQTGTISADERGNPSTVQPGWIVGVARAELPWLGLIKLSLAGTYNQPACAPRQLEYHFFSPSPTCAGWVGLGHAFAPKDLWVMLFVALFLLIVVPLVVDAVRRWRAKKDEPPPAP